MSPVPVRPWDEVPATGPLFRVRAAAQYLGLSISHYYALAQRGELPSVIKIGERAAGVPKPWLDAVVSARAGEGK